MSTIENAMNTLLHLSELPFGGLEATEISYRAYHQQPTTADGLLLADGTSLDPSRGVQAADPMLLPGLADGDALDWEMPGAFDYYGDPTALSPLPPPDANGENAGNDGLALRTTVATTRDHREARQAHRTPAHTLRAWPLDLLPGPSPAYFNDPAYDGLPTSSCKDQPPEASRNAGSRSRLTANTPEASDATLGVSAQKCGIDAAVGLYVQQDNTLTLPAQPPSALSKDEPSSSSPTSASHDARPSQKRARPSMAGAADETREAKRLRVCSEGSTTTNDNVASENTADGDTADEDAERSSIPFEDTPAGRLCANRRVEDITPWIPIPCFVCEDRRAADATGSSSADEKAALPCKPKMVNGKPYTYNSWDSFTRHVRSCMWAGRPDMWPVCHFCKQPIWAVERPDQMARHLVGSHGNGACEALQTLMHGGVTTNGALADWLNARRLPIRTEFLGQKLAVALRKARSGRKNEPVGRELKLAIPLRERKGEAAPKEPVAANTSDFIFEIMNPDILHGDPEYKATVIAACANHEKENRYKGDYRACIRTTRHVVKYGSFKELRPELLTHSYIAEYARTFKTPNTPRIADISHFVHNKILYLLIDPVTLADSPQSTDLYERICQALVWLAHVPAPAGHVLGPLGDGRLRNGFFKDNQAPQPFPNKEALNAYIQKGYDAVYKRVPQAKRPPFPTILDDRVLCAQSDVDVSNFGVDEAGQTVLMDFGAVGWLPESFAALTLASDERLEAVAETLGLAGRVKVETLARISSHLQMLSDPTFRGRASQRKPAGV
ncbi:hypothetical protein AURDEDRAFT_153049 [Auricularia subglabra TFB-10046 SS5]|nr:hypothetical protein AURDEDRAFT_153049 [Auricularia subglabra TFB-10046 SS5]